MEEKIEISILCQIYGKLLTEKQLEILDDYYNNDLSLSEIAENNNITRQAVKDTITKAKNKLFEYESKLNIEKENEKRKQNKNRIIKLLKENKVQQGDIDKIISLIE